MDERLMAARLGRIPLRLRAAFAAECASRSLPIVAFQGRNDDIARRAVEFVWNLATTNRIDDESLVTIEQQVQAATPDIDREPGLSATLMVYLAAGAALDAIVDSSGASAATAATCVVDAVDLVTDYLEQPRQDSEVEWQSRALDFLEKWGDMPRVEMFRQVGGYPPLWAALVVPKIT
jgi:hypothetical protein